MLALAARVPDRRPGTVLKAIAGELEKEGVTLLDSTTYLSSCVAGKGVMTRAAPGKAVLDEIAFGSPSPASWRGST